MTKMVITEKSLSKREVYRVVNTYYHGKYTMRYKRGQISLFFPNKDLKQSQVEQIAGLWKMYIISISPVSAVIGY